MLAIVFILLLFCAYHQLLFQMLMFYVFFCLYYSIIFLAFALEPVQRGDNFNEMSNFDWYIYIVACISFTFYLLVAIYMFYPYR